jgi:hypothetical protein
MSVERNKDLARQAIGIWTTGVFDAVDELYAPEYVNHQHHDPDDPRDIHGAEAMKRFARKFREAFPDFHDSVDGDPQGHVHGRRAHEQGAHLDRDNHRSYRRGQDRRELGQLGHDGHDAATERGFRAE